MREKKIRQYEIAQVLRINPTTVSEILGGIGRELAPHERQRIAELLGLTAEWLFTEVHPPASARLAPKVDKDEVKNGSEKKE
jgi:transcriptional regulator with XRE-family HTH domain